mmetsp:Transcript_8669/g.22422  ORF Transcript_8669/g.22422 Transcript_8669/m.22422 type:complete len:157 (-) Transcript_8669:31-501(-)
MPRHRADEAELRATYGRHYIPRPSNESDPQRIQRLDRMRINKRRSDAAASSDMFNVAQARHFAMAFDTPLVRWKLALGATESPPVDDAQLDDLYAEEPSMWGYFVRGAPVCLTKNGMAMAGLVNSGAGLCHSLSLDGNVDEESFTPSEHWPPHIRG